MGGSHHNHGTEMPDVALLDSQRGLRVTLVSFAILIATTAMQGLVYLFVGSVALLADTIHNLGDAVTAIPLAVAFVLATWRSSRRFRYGYGRAEDLAGAFIVIMIIASGIFIAWQSLARFRDPVELDHLGILAIAAIVGFIGNELVARYRIINGKRIGSAALVADGYHARADGLTSLGVLAGAFGVWLGIPGADPFFGLIISVAILYTGYHTGWPVLMRLMDGIEPRRIHRFQHLVARTPGVVEVKDIRARWIGHRLHVEVLISVPGDLSVTEGHDIAEAVAHEIRYHSRHAYWINVHVDPVGAPLIQVGEPVTLERIRHS